MAITAYQAGTATLVRETAFRFLNWWDMTLDVTRPARILPAGTLVEVLEYRHDKNSFVRIIGGIHYAWATVEGFEEC